jgi:hypothetical protein
MAKINLTRKSQSEQLRILNDYVLRREQHKNQGAVTVDHLVNRFRHNRCFTNKAKSAFLSKLLWTLEETNKQSNTIEIEG